MKVKVIPMRPIPGILPKNKWIDTEIELDLNVMEIRRCMQYGSVYYENEIMDNTKLCLFNNDETKLSSVKIELPQRIITTETKGVLEIDEKEVTSLKSDQPSKSFIENNQSDETEIDNELKIKELSCIREDNYIILELQFNTNSLFNLDNVNGTFKVNSGSKIEYKSDSDKWVKFNYKFNTFEQLENDTKFIFRFIPNHKSLLKYHLILKQDKEDGIEVDLSGTIDQSNL